MTKTHLGSRGTGTPPVCKHGTRVTSGYSLSLDRFDLEVEAYKCARCAKYADKVRSIRKPVRAGAA